jgi:hypothetical protein
MVTRIRLRVVEIFHRNHSWAEFWAAMGGILFGWSSWHNPLAMSGFSSLTVVLSIMPEHWWELLAVVAGLFQLYALYVDQRWLRMLAAIVNCGWISVMTAAMMLGDPVSFWWPFVAAAAGCNLFAVIRLVGNVR